MLKVLGSFVFGALAVIGVGVLVVRKSGDEQMNSFFDRRIDSIKVSATESINQFKKKFSKHLEEQAA